MSKEAMIRSCLFWEILYKNPKGVSLSLSMDIGKKQFWNHLVQTISKNTHKKSSKSSNSFQNKSQSGNFWLMKNSITLNNFKELADSWKIKEMHSSNKLREKWKYHKLITMNSSKSGTNFMKSLCQIILNKTTNLYSIKSKKVAKKFLKS